MTPPPKYRNQSPEYSITFIGGHPYRYVKTPFGSFPLSELVWARYHPGEPLEGGEVLQHVNGDTLDDRPENLTKAKRKEGGLVQALFAQAEPAIGRQDAMRRSVARYWNDRELWERRNLYAPSNHHYHKDHPTGEYRLFKHDRSPWDRIKQTKRAAQLAETQPTTPPQPKTRKKRLEEIHSLTKRGSRERALYRSLQGNPPQVEPGSDEPGDSVG